MASVANMLLAIGREYSDVCNQRDNQYRTMAELGKQRNLMIAILEDLEARFDFDSDHDIPEILVLRVREANAMIRGE